VTSIGNKKKSGRAKSWKLAGEPVYPSMLPPEEERIFADIFFWNEMFTIDAPPMFDVPASLMRSRESAARASLEFFCRQFGKKYQRKEIVEALATTASLPTTFSEQIHDTMSFLLGAALWILDHVNERQLKEKFDPLLPPEPDDEVIFRVPTVDDFTHSWTDILRLMSVLSGRKDRHRKAFRNILSLIDKETAARLRGSFRDVLFDYFGRLMEVSTRVKKPKASVKNLPPLKLSAVSVLDDILDMTDPSQPPPVPAEDDPVVEFLMKSLILIGAPMEELQRELNSRKSAELLTGFTVRDPYEVCAAYLILEKEDDVLTALNMLTGAVAACADRHLPWACGVPLSYAVTDEDGRQDYTLRYPFSGSTDEEDDLPSVEMENGHLLSEAQLFYAATGYALPRGYVPSQHLTEWFMRQGLPEGRSRELTWGAMIASCLDDWRDRDFWDREFSWDSPPDTDGPEPEAEQAEGQEESPANTGRVEELTRQIKELRRAAHDAERAARQLQDRLLETERQARCDRDELSQLRDTLFRIRSGEEAEEETEETGVELPFQVRRRVLAFGGHETWRKAIRPLLPGVRFFEKDVLPDISALKVADSVWIQTNAISHKFYYRIIDTARKNGIPVRYFGFASARKCAEQLVNDELSAEKT